LRKGERSRLPQQPLHQESPESPAAFERLFSGGRLCIKCKEIMAADTVPGETDSQQYELRPTFENTDVQRPLGVVDCQPKNLKLVNCQ
jgi:hypothetical protein